jgi:hypothetical protein
LFQDWRSVSIWSHRFYYSDIDCSAVDLLCYERKKWESSQGPEEGDVETTKENIE